MDNRVTQGVPPSDFNSDADEGTLNPADEKHVTTEPQPDVEAPPKPPQAGPSPPPNGGLQAWLHVLGGFMLFFNNWGLLNTFGVFQTYYESGALFKESSSNIAWIGAIQAVMLLISGVVVGPIYDRGYLRALLIVGAFLVVFGHMMLSLCTTYWEALLAQGFCIGIGSGCLFFPTISVLPTYFSTKMGLAIGIASSGSSLGGIIYPIVVYELIGKIGFPWAVRVVGFMALGTLLIPICVMKMRFKVAKPRAMIDTTAFTDVEFMIFVVGTFIGFISLAVIILYISFFPENKHITDSRLAFYMVPIFNAGSCLGRVVPNALSDKVGPFNIIAPSAIITGVIAFCMMAVTSEASMIVLAILLGFFSGVFIAMPPVCMATLTKNKSLIGTRIGTGYTIIALGLLVGGPGGGGILGTRDPLNWNGIWALGGATAIFGGVVYAGLRVVRHGFKLNVKA